MKRWVQALAIIMTLLAMPSSFAQQSGETSEAKLLHKWTLKGFDRPESLILSADGSEIYVSNVNGDSNAIDGNGYISRVSRNSGKIIEKKWITGLNGPKGFALDDGKIYIADIKDLVVVDISEKKITNRVPIPDAVFLNDVAVIKGRVFISDTGGDKLYSYTDEKGITIFKSGEQVNAINGLVSKDDKLLLTLMETGELVSLNPDDGKMNSLAKGLANGDGIGVLPDGGYLITSYSGEIYHISFNWGWRLILDSKPDNISQNDSFYYNNVLYVANMNSGSITAWHVTVKLIPSTDF